MPTAAGPTAAGDVVWRQELDLVLRAEGIQLAAFAGAANVYSRLDAATRAAVDRVAAQVERVGLVFHPDQTAVAVLDASGRGPAEFAALLLTMGADIPTSWITRTTAWLSSRANAWSAASAAFRAVSPSTPLSFEAVLEAVRRAGGSNRKEASSSLLECYRALGLDDARQLCDRALALWSAEPDLRDECEQILARAACVLPGALQGRYARLLDAEILHPPWLFRGADDVARARLIRMLETDGTAPEFRLALAALAWTEGDDVARRLAHWGSSAGAPPWRTDLRVSPRDYAQQAGWWLSETGETRPLVNQSCRPLITRYTGTPPLVVFAPAGEICPSCSGPLSFAVDLDLARADLAFLALIGARLRILTCERCTAFTPIYCEVTLDGSARWSARNTCPDPPDRGPWTPIGESEMWLAEPIAATEALARVADDQSQLGGYPSWEQDADYPPCPGCAKPMPCIGQLAMQGLGGGEGFIYLFVDAACGFAATTFQQT